MLGQPSADALALDHAWITLRARGPFA